VTFDDAAYEADLDETPNTPAEPPLPLLLATVPPSIYDVDLRPARDHC